MMKASDLDQVVLLLDARKKLMEMIKCDYLRLEVGKECSITAYDNPRIGSDQTTILFSKMYERFSDALVASKDDLETKLRSLGVEPSE